MTVKARRVSLSALVALLCTFAVGSAGTVWADDAPGSSVDSTKYADESMPPPDEFMAVDVNAVPRNQPPAVYPDSAKAAQIEGNVWVRVLVDRQGNVRKALIAKGSGKEVGFEEAALTAARQATWKPAMLNGKPVASWVSYEIKFLLSDEKR